MELHEKSLELNITHELLSLGDSWYWFLTDIPLWRYWRPRYRLPFLKYPGSTASGFHITTEGKEDSSGNAGGGYDVRIKAGLGKHLLFIQYKKGDLKEDSPNLNSEFEKAPHEHFVFKINSTSTNQHFVLRNLANGIGKEKGNAVVYAFPLIKDIPDMEANAGKLIRKTKFVSIIDIDLQAIKNKVTITKDVEHNFRIGKYDMSRCEVNYFYYFFLGKDRTPDLIADIIALNFQKTLKFFINEIKKNFIDYNLQEDYVAEGIQQAYVQYLRYLLHYFEVEPSKFNQSSLIFFKGYKNYFNEEEFSKYQSSKRDIEILTSVFNSLNPFAEYINSAITKKENNEELKNEYSVFRKEIPVYKPKFIFEIESDNDLLITFEKNITKEQIENINYLVF